MPDASEEALLRRKALQFLVHSFLYYKLGEPVVSDSFFDQLSEELRSLREKYPEAEMPYTDLIEPALGPEASAFQLKTYPPRIISTAFKLLYTVNAPDMDFMEFVERRGYQAQLDPELATA